MRRILALSIQKDPAFREVPFAFGPHAPRAGPANEMAHYNRRLLCLAYAEKAKIAGCAEK